MMLLTSGEFLRLLEESLVGSKPKYLLSYSLLVSWETTFIIPVIVFLLFRGDSGPALTAAAYCTVCCQALSASRGLSHLRLTTTPRPYRHFHFARESLRDVKGGRSEAVFVSISRSEF